MPALLSNTSYATLDGRSGAPTRAAGPQLPTAFTDFGCVVRPPWQVAGIDYPVGIDDAYSGSLLDPAVYSFPSGISYSAANKRIQFSSGSPSSYTFEGLDFSLNGGLYILGSNNANTPLTLTFRNCKFGIGINNGMGITVSRPDTVLTVEKCLIDGGGYNDGGLSWVDWTNSQTVTSGNYYRTPFEGRIYQATNNGTTVSGTNTEGGLTEPRVDTSTTSGTATFDFVRKGQKTPLLTLQCNAIIRYNHFINVPYDSISWSSADYLTSKYNLFEAGNWMCSGHTDHHQCGGGRIWNAAITCAFNTVVQGATQTVRGHPGGINSLIRIGDLGGVNVHDPQAYCNTVFGDPLKNHNGTENTLDVASVNQVFQFRGQGSGNAIIYRPCYTNNYVTLDALSSGFYVIAGESPPYTVGPVFKNLIDMRTGNSLAYPGGA